MAVQERNRALVCKYTYFAWLGPLSRGLQKRPWLRGDASVELPKGEGVMVAKPLHRLPLQTHK
jgi:hypothetical protein